MNILYQSLGILILCGLLSCNMANNTDRNNQTTTEASDSINEPAAVEAEYTLLDEFGVEEDEEEYAYIPPSVNLFNLYEYDHRKGFTFSSLSNIYNDEDETEVIPSLEGKTSKDVQYLPLNGEYRTLFLTGTKIAESDSVFVYNYQDNKLFAFEVRDVKVVAYLSPYESYESPEDLKNISGSSYQIGFEFESKAVKWDDNSTFYVTVAKENPFAMKKMQAMKWTKVDSDKFPLKKIPRIWIDSSLAEMKKGDTYMYEYNGLQFFLQNYQGEYSVYRRLIVVDKNTKEYVADHFATDNEGSYPAPLNGIESEGYTYQWIGQLFENEPMVAFGFEFVSFGCESLYVLDGSNREIYIQCDNRH